MWTWEGAGHLYILVGHTEIPKPIVGSKLAAAQVDTCRNYKQECVISSALQNWTIRNWPSRVSLGINPGKYYSLLNKLCKSFALHARRSLPVRSCPVEPFHGGFLSTTSWPYSFNQCCMRCAGSRTVLGSRLVLLCFNRSLSRFLGATTARNLTTNFICGCQWCCGSSASFESPLDHRFIRTRHHSEYHWSTIRTRHVLAMQKEHIVPLETELNSFPLFGSHCRGLVAWMLHYDCKSSEKWRSTWWCCDR